MRRPNRHLLDFQASEVASLLQVLELLPSFRVLRVQKERVLGLNDHIALVDGLSNAVNGLAGVSSAVFSVGVQDVKSDKSKVMSGPEPMASDDLAVVDVPLNS